LKRLGVGTRPGLREAQEPEDELERERMAMQQVIFRSWLLSFLFSDMSLTCDMTMSCHSLADTWDRANGGSSSASNTSGCFVGVLGVGGSPAVLCC